MAKITARPSLAAVALANPGALAAREAMARANEAKLLGWANPRPAALVGPVAARDVAKALGLRR